MPKITWLGDTECVWNDVTFPAGVPVETDDPYMLGKARNSPFFSVDDVPAIQWREPDTEADPADDPPPRRKRGRPPKVRNNGNGDQ